MSDPGSSPQVSRRSLLSAAALTPLLAACAQFPPTGSRSPSPTGTPVFTPGRNGLGPVTRGTLNSQATQSTPKWLIYYPPDATEGDPLPVAIMMHGLGDSIAALDANHYSQALYDTVVHDHTPPFAIAAIDGGTTFWQRDGSRDGGALIADEFVGELTRRGLDTSRLALTGWSMGGWGSLRLACDELHGKLKAIAPLSAPCYLRYEHVPDPTWMSRAAFDRNNFYTRPKRLTDLPIFLACGTQDPFYSGNAAFAKILRSTRGVGPLVTDFGPGAHSAQYWNSVAGAQLSFLGQHLAA
ncbi:MAG: esterase family protein [Propionicimonas sp.]